MHFNLALHNLTAAYGRFFRAGNNMAYKVIVGDYRFLIENPSKDFVALTHGKEITSLEVFKSILKTYLPNHSLPFSAPPKTFFIYARRAKQGEQNYPKS